VLLVLRRAGVAQGTDGAGRSKGPGWDELFAEGLVSNAECTTFVKGAFG
jgi:hypothetical protein